MNRFSSVRVERFLEGITFGLNDTLIIQYKTMDGVNVAATWEVKPVLQAEPLIGFRIKPVEGIEGGDGFGSREFR